MPTNRAPCGIKQNRPEGVSYTVSVTCAVICPGRSERTPVIRAAGMIVPAWMTKGDAGREILSGATVRRSVWMPNNSVPTRRARQHEPAKYLRRQRRRLPNRSRQRKRQPTLPHLRMKPSRRTGRIASCCSSTLRSTGARPRLTGFRAPHRLLSSRRERSYRRP